MKLFEEGGVVTKENGAGIRDDEVSVIIQRAERNMEEFEAIINNAIVQIRDRANRLHRYADHKVLGVVRPRQAAKNLEFAANLLESLPFKLTDEHASKVKPFTLGLVWIENGEERAMDFDIPFDEIKAIFNQVVDNINE